ncbi:MAG: hypothetical protein IJC54_05810, partial [Clostridia bacterium]|nr:hypothetical protein [Clostridia bacterium]
DGQLICSGGSSLYIQAGGSACLHSGGVLVNRWRLDGALAGDGFFTFVREDGSAPVSLLGGPARFSPGLALLRQKGEALDYRLSYSLSPEDGALVRLLTITNRTGRPVRAEVRDIAALSLCTDAQAQDHQSFQDLFVEASYPSAQCLRLIKRPRDEADGVLALDYTISGVEEGDSCTLIADRPGMLRRGADPSRAQHVFSSEVCPREEGAGLVPVQGARILLTVPAHGERIVGFATLVSRRAGRSALPEADRYAQIAALQRAQRLCEEQSREMFRFLDLSAHNARLYGRAAALCMYARPMQRKTVSCESGIGKEALWPLGISGDRPLLLAHTKPGAAGSAIEILRLQAYLCTMGVQADAIVLYSEEEGYSQPLRDDLRQRIAEMRLPGADVYLVSERSADPRALEAVRRLCALELDAEDTLERIFDDPARWQKLTLPEQADLPAQPAPDRNYGAFSEGGNAYTVRLRPGESTPRAWSNILTGERMGSLVSEGGGGFLWHENSRSGRLTAFGSDVQSEPAPIRLWIEENECTTELIPRPLGTAAQVTVRPGETETVFEQNGLRVHILRYTHPEHSVHIASVRVEAADGKAHSFRIHAACLWQMGVHAQDMRALQTAFDSDCQLAFGSVPFVGCMRLPGAHAEGGHLVLEGDAPCAVALYITAADTAQQAVQLARETDAGQVRALCREEWEKLLGKVRIETGETIADAILSQWAPYQAISARLRARTGPNQPGGAYGFRDQLQDVLCLMPVEPMWAREHILLCAAHQFPEGDVQHWWHPPRTGVRTRISDDLLFLPYVAARYVLETGDRAVLAEVVPYLRGRPVPPEKHDLYFEPEVSELCEPLREHCMRAIRRVAGLVGKHGLPLMGSGDWNDGMDRIGAQGKGESVWLAQFLCVAARDFAAVCPQYANELQEISHRMLENIERHAWDGDRYLRAFRDDGTPVGSERTEGGCKIDLLAQSWAVFAGCDAERVKIAMDTAISRLYEPEHGILRLLDPPFDGNIGDTGYIAAYPPGVRENGGQYTHAACWAMMACAQMGDRARAWQILRVLLPASHAATREQADRYQAEPYAVAADIYACRAAYAGRAGWTWYTGSAGWLQRAFLTGIADLERRGSRVRMCALLDEGMDEMRVMLRFGAATYALVSGRRYTNADWAELIDDGAEHELYFGAR